MTINYLDLKRINDMHADEIRQAASAVIDSGWYLQGEAVARFEHDYAAFIGTRHCVSCGNGLDALRLIMRGYMELGKLSEGDEVIVPANTYIATILAITDCGLVPVLVEPRMDTLLIDDSLIEQKLSPKTRAVMLVHLYGRCSMTARIAAICRRHGLLLFEDNAQAHGCMFEGRRTGSLGNAAAHSFYPGKNLGALGDAGAVTTDDSQLAEVVRAVANYGSSRKYVFDYQGLNSRMDEIQAAVLAVKLRYLDDDNARRKVIARYYDENIRVEGVSTVPFRNADNVVHIYPVMCDDRDALRQHLSDRGIGTVIHYPIPPHHQRCYSQWNHLSLPITETIHQRELSLPCHQAMTDAEVEFVADAVNSL
ncbi:MAG: DegT/DnrJ/EryC1/StrS family aminotransferase [Prevotella sp.]